MYYTIAPMGTGTSRLCATNALNPGGATFEKTLVTGGCVFFRTCTNLAHMIQISHSTNIVCSTAWWQYFNTTLTVLWSCGTRITFALPRHRAPAASQMKCTISLSNIMLKTTCFPFHMHPSQIWPIKRTFLPSLFVGTSWLQTTSTCSEDAEAWICLQLLLKPLNCLKLCVKVHYEYHYSNYRIRQPTSRVSQSDTGFFKKSRQFHMGPPSRAILVSNVCICFRDDCFREKRWMLYQTCQNTEKKPPKEHHTIKTNKARREPAKRNICSTFAREKICSPFPFDTSGQAFV